MRKSFEATIVRDGSMCFIPVPFDPAPVFGKVRAPVKVTVGGHTYRSTIASMGNGPCLPLRRSNREAAGLEGGETTTVTLELDTEAREVEAPADLHEALRAAGAAAAWDALSYSHRREHVEAIEQAKKPETRERRIEAAVAMVAAKAEAQPMRRAKAEAKPMRRAKAEAQPMRRAKAEAKPMRRAKAEAQP
ncbi:MAG TPA: YdeI/OmpD-associated family protein, partial [Kofleriaceae bacterium]|nr:YdeI/OmpD-associated family protein [Kofleriaceae bacterium]